MDKSSMDAVAESIVKIPDVVEIVKSTGKFDLLVFVLLKDINQLLDIQDQISCINGVKSIEQDVGRNYESLPVPLEWISTF